MVNMNGNGESQKTGYYLQIIGIFLAALLLVIVTLRVNQLMLGDSAIKKNQDVIQKQLIDIHEHLHHLDKAISTPTLTVTPTISVTGTLSTTGTP